MVTSNVMRCALLAASVNKQNHLFQSNYLAGLAALGLYELEACGSLTWDGDRCVLGQSVPEERAYLAGLYQSIAGEADHSMRGLLGMMLKQGAQAFSEQVNQWMVDQGWVTVTTKKGLFGVESQRLEAAPQEVAAVKQFVLAVTTGEPVTAEQLTLAQVLLKTELLYECFDRQEAKAVKTGLVSAAEPGRQWQLEAAGDHRPGGCLGAGGGDDCCAELTTSAIKTTPDTIW